MNPPIMNKLSLIDVFVYEVSLIECVRTMPERLKKQPLSKQHNQGMSRINLDRTLLLEESLILSNEFLIRWPPTGYESSFTECCQLASWRLPH